MDAISVNYIDTEEYPSTEKIKEKCVNMLADLWHADKSSPPTGTDTVGSSEAVLLGGLALKRKWQARRKAEGKDISKPNIVMGTETHVVWEKLTNYFDIEPKWVANRPGEYIARNEDLVAACDENTIGVVAILGTTYTGAFYNVEELDKLVEAKNKETGWGLKIHVDAASGGFVAPFAFPDFKWDFRLPNVVSINASGHKFGLVYPGLGWVMWRSRDHLDDSLVFHDNYLGKDQITFTLNFSKGAMNVLREGLKRLGFVIVSQENEPCLPLITFHLPEERQYDEYHIADKLRAFGWVVPAYTLARDNTNRKVLRVVCRWDFNPTLAEELLENIQESMEWLDAHHIYTDEQLKQIGVNVSVLDSSKKKNKREASLEDRGHC
eukprot:gene7642-7844_t